MYSQYDNNNNNYNNFIITRHSVSIRFYYHYYYYYYYYLSCDIHKESLALTGIIQYTRARYNIREILALNLFGAHGEYRFREPLTRDRTVTRVYRAYYFVSCRRGLNSRVGFGQETTRVYRRRRRTTVLHG